MKTVQKAAKEQAYKYVHDDIQYSHPNFVANERIQAFELGVEFAQRWIPIDESLPDKDVVVIARNTTFVTPQIWLTTISKGRLISLYTNSDGQIDATHWRPIELKYN